MSTTLKNHTLLNLFITIGFMAITPIAFSATEISTPNIKKITLQEVLAKSSGVTSLNSLSDTNLGAPTKKLSLFKSSEGLSELPIGGGYGGNDKHKLTYDGHFISQLFITRDETSSTCALSNADVDVYNANNIVTYSCNTTDPAHYNLYWNNNNDSVNGGYSPANDALFAGKTLLNMFRQYGHALVNKDGSPIKLTIVVHGNVANSNSNGIGNYTLGDGNDTFYPWTTLAAIANLVGIDFTKLNIDVDMDSQSDASSVARAFGAMTGQAAEYYAFEQRNSWLYYGGIFKQAGEPDFRNLRDGQFEYAFYLLAAMSGREWDVRKAYSVMVQANLYYWTQSMNLAEAACGVLRATRDYGYDIAAVRNAFTRAHIDTGC